MSVSQTKKIKEAAAAVERQPRSIRLTKAHREDILEAVMKQWETVNPVPAVMGIGDVVVALLAQYRNVKRGPHEFRALTKILEASKEISDFRNAASETAKGILKSLTTSSAFNVSLIKEDGSTGGHFTFRIPTQLADELGIPYVSTDTESFLAPSTYPWLKYASAPDSEGRVSVEYAEFYCSHRWHHSIAIPRDFKPYVQYLEDQKKTKAWEDEQRQQRREVTDFLDQFNTTNQIREAWPELVPYLPAHLADPERVIKLPALATSRLNERLGLK